VWAAERVDDLQAQLHDMYPEELPECTMGGGLKGRIENLEAAVATLVAAQVRPSGHPAPLTACNLSALIRMQNLTHQPCPHGQG
jgi:hypothetical protein